MTVLKAQLLRVVGGWYEVVPQVADGGHRLERACHHLGGSRAIGGVLQFGLEQFGVGEDDAQLVVEPMKEEAEFWRVDHVWPLGLVVG